MGDFCSFLIKNGPALLDCIKNLAPLLEQCRPAVEQMAQAISEEDAS